MLEHTVANVAVAIATLDRPGGLERCVHAVLDGEVLPREIVIVDQGTDERTPAFISSLEAGVVPVHYQRQAGRGLSRSRNAAIRQASATTIAFTDDDCVPHPHWVAAIANAIQAYPDAASVAGRVLPFGPEQEGTFSVSPRESTEKREFRRRVAPWLVGSGGNLAVQRCWFFNVGGFDERLGAGSSGHAAEDMDLIHRILRAGGCVVYEPDAVVYHERQTRTRRLTTRWTYAFGMGAFLGIWLRRRDRYALHLLGIWLATLTRELVSISLKRHDLFGAYQRGLGMAGTARGLVYGLTVSECQSRSTRRQPVHMPKATDLLEE